jgi:hypothetical protein
MKSALKVAVVGMLLIGLGAAVLHRRYRVLPPPPTAASEARAARDGSEPEPPKRVGLRGAPVGPAAAEAGAQATPTPATGWLQQLLGENGERAELAPEVLERWLASGRTNAESLLAACQAGGGDRYLRMALTNFPNDPRVLLAASGLNDGPEARRERLDRLKAAAPENALAYYLSARDHLQNSRPDQAVADLLAASGRSHFEDYTLDAMQNAEDLYLQAGKSPAEAKVLGVSTAPLPHLAQLKGLAVDLNELEQRFVAAGDAASAENLAQMGVRLGEQLSAGEGARCLINQLVGTAVEQIVLRPLEADRSYDFLQGNVRDYLGQLGTRRAATKQDGQFLDAWMPGASEADLISYFDRFKIYGESAALAWLKQRQGGQ